MSREPSPYLEFRVIHPLEHDLGAGLAAGGGGGRAAEGGEEAARRGCGGAVRAEGGGAPAPPEERQRLRRHGDLPGLYGLASLQPLTAVVNFLASRCRWIEKGWAAFLSFWAFSPPPKKTIGPSCLFCSRKRARSSRLFHCLTGLEHL